MNSYDIVAEAVKDYWKAEYPQDVVAFFQQKYSWDDKWEKCEELVECHGSDDYERMTFLSDFCEGQTEVKDVVIIPLRKVTAFYYQRKIENTEDVVPVRHGRWVKESVDLSTEYYGLQGMIDYFSCSLCGDEEEVASDYCPGCGARMDGE